jgi:hypothetical protein
MKNGRIKKKKTRYKVMHNRTEYRLVRHECWLTVQQSIYNFLINAVILFRRWGLLKL